VAGASPPHAVSVPLTTTQHGHTHGPNLPDCWLAWNPPPGGGCSCPGRSPGARFVPIRRRRDRRSASATSNASAASTASQTTHPICGPPRTAHLTLPTCHRRCWAPARLDAVRAPADRRAPWSREALTRPARPAPVAAGASACDQQRGRDPRLPSWFSSVLPFPYTCRAHVPARPRTVARSVHLPTRATRPRVSYPSAVVAGSSGSTLVAPGGAPLRQRSVLRSGRTVRGSLLPNCTCVPGHRPRSTQLGRHTEQPRHGRRGATDDAVVSAWSGATE
jgi:hypothetical protein